jgi:hypothetical protein
MQKQNSAANRAKSLNGKELTSSCIRSNMNVFFLIETRSAFHLHPPAIFLVVGGRSLECLRANAAQLAASHRFQMQQQRSGSSILVGKSDANYDC